MQILEFIFSSFYVWLGTLILLMVLIPWNKTSINVGKPKDEKNCGSHKCSSCKHKQDDNN
jgi:hypothetical protein